MPIGPTREVDDLFSSYLIVPSAKFKDFMSPLLAKKEN
jgi:hypothetical protein